MTSAPTERGLGFLPQLASIVPYVPGASVQQVRARFRLDKIVKLASNEFPLPPFDEVKAVVTRSLDELNRYPDGSCLELRRDLAARFGRSPEEVVIGNGSCELIIWLARALLQPGDEAVMAQPSFLLYDGVCRQQGARGVTIPVRDHVPDLEAMLAAIGPRTKIVFVCNPNNPTGAYLSAARMAEFMAAVPAEVLVVLDEAYNEFVTAGDWQDAPGLQRRYGNVVVLRTFSKIYGLCGLRVGYGLCAPDVRDAVDRVRQPFNVNHLAQVAAREALRHDDQMLERRRGNAARRAHLERELESMGRPFVPSEANFMLVGTEGLSLPQDQVCERLMSMGSIVRDGNAFGYPGWARVSIGTTAEIDFFLAHLQSLQPSGWSAGGST